MDEVVAQLRIHGGRKGEPFLVNVQFLPHCLFYASLGMKDGRGSPSSPLVVQATSVEREARKRQVTIALIERYV